MLTLFNFNPSSLMYMQLFGNVFSFSFYVILFTKTGNISYNNGIVHRSNILTGYVIKAAYTPTLFLSAVCACYAIKEIFFMLKKIWKGLEKKIFLRLSSSSSLFCFVFKKKKRIIQ